MFLSKIFSKCSNTAIKHVNENALLSFPMCRTFSDSVPSTETAQPDKLYKKIEVEVRGNDKAVLQSYGIFATKAADHLGIIVGGNFAPRKHTHQRLTLLKAKHVYKKHRVQYEIRTYYRFLEFLKLTGSTADTFLEYIQRNLPEGVAMKVTKTEIQRLPETVSTPPS